MKQRKLILMVPDFDTVAERVSSLLMTIFKDYEFTVQDSARGLTTDAPVVVDTCPYCKKDHDVRLACPEYKKMLEFRYNQAAGIKPRRR